MQMLTISQVDITSLKMMAQLTSLQEIGYVFPKNVKHLAHLGNIYAKWLASLKFMILTIPF